MTPTRKTARNTLIPALLATAVTLGGCADYDRAASAKSEPAAAAPAASAAADMDDGRMAADTAGGEGDDAPAAQKAPIQRKLIQTAELHVQVSSYAAARTQIEKNLSEMGGFIADAKVEHSDGSVSHADLTIRIPSDKLADFLAGTAGHGEVMHETIQSQDITAGYYDTKAHLKNAKRMEARLLSLLDTKANSVSSLLEVERELARVRGQVESFEGKLRLWDKQVSLSTVRLRLVTEQVYVVSQPPTPPTVMDRLGSTLGGSFAALKGFGLGLLVLLVALVPWLIPLGLAGVAVRAVLRRLLRVRGRRATASMPKSVPVSAGRSAV
jgi:hypothetical protein